VRLRTASAESVAATMLEQQRMRVTEPFEAGCRLATQQSSGSCRVPPQSRRDADGGPTARIPQPGNFEVLSTFGKFAGM